ITVNVNNAALEIKLDNTTKILDTNGSDIKLADIKQRDKIQVLQPTYDAAVAPLRVVKVLNGQTGNHIKGKLFDVTGRAIIMEIDGELVTKVLARNPKVTIPSVENATIDSLLKGSDEISVILN